MSAWAMLAAPLLLGNDPRNVNPTDTAIMQNERIIAMNQDVDGVQGFRIQCEKVACPEEGSGCRCDRHVWMRELSGGRYSELGIKYCDRIYRHRWAQPLFELISGGNSVFLKRKFLYFDRNDNSFNMTLQAVGVDLSK